MRKNYTGKNTRKRLVVVVKVLSSVKFQVKLVNEKLLSAGYKTFVTRFPERTSDIGQMINQYLKNNNDLSDQAVHLLFSANRWEYNSLIKGKYTVRC